MVSSDERAPTMLSNLASISKKGITLYLNGHSSTPDEIADICVNDETLYMPDYVMDELGVLKEIRYDKVVYN